MTVSGTGTRCRRSVIARYQSRLYKCALVLSDRQSKAHTMDVTGCTIVVYVCIALSGMPPEPSYLAE